MTAALEAVTFDFWNTLVYEERGEVRGRRFEAWAGILEEAGFACEREQLGAVFDHTWERYVESWNANQQYLAAQAAEDGIEKLGFDVPAEVRQALIDAYSLAGEQAELHVTDGVGDAIQGLKDAGLRVGIVCDVGFTGSTTLRNHLIKAGLLPLFDHWSFSDEVGAYKPSPVIFEHALAGLGDPAPERVAHVGDLRRTDIAGALSMGMVAVRYTGVFDDDSATEPEGHHVLASHRDLLTALGV
jgi:putative hydrolase of the HAD superfamily